MTARNPVACVDEMTGEQPAAAPKLDHQPVPGEHGCERLQHAGCDQIGVDASCPKATHVSHHRPDGCGRRLTPPPRLLLGELWAPAPPACPSRAYLIVGSHVRDRWGPPAERNVVPHPVVHAEIRSQDPEATRRFFADLFGWKVASEGAFPGYTFIDTGVEGGTYVAISPRQGTEDEVLFFVAVDDVAATLIKAEELGGRIVQPEQTVPGTAFGVFADAQGHKVGVAATR